MLPCDPVLHRQIPVIQKIIQDETWLEGERRGCQVQSDDSVVRENVCRVILRVGHEIRESITRDLLTQDAPVFSVNTAVAVRVNGDMLDGKSSATDPVF